MHSQPRLKLPAERLPKLERDKKKQDSGTKKYELGIQANLQLQNIFNCKNYTLKTSLVTTIQNKII